MRFEVAGMTVEIRSHSTTAIARNAIAHIARCAGSCSTKNTPHAVAHKSTGALNIATGEVHSFRDIADEVAAISGKRSAVKGSPRSGPMPHGGYRPFDIAACRRAFPDFRYTPLREGLRKSAGISA